MYELTRLLRAAGDGAGAGEGDPTPTGDTGQSGDVYTKEQLEAFRDTHLANARRKWDKEKAEIEKNLYTKLGISSADEIEEINRLREEAKQAEQRKREEKGEYEKILAERDKKHQQEKQEILNQKLQADNNFLDLAKEINLSQAALKAGADPATLDLVIAFTKSQVKVLDKNSVIPVDSHGEVPLNPDTGKEMTLDDFMKSFLADRPNLVKGSGTSGAGSHPGGRANGKLPTLDAIKEAAQSNPEQYKKWRDDGTIKAVQEAERKQ